MSTSQTTKKQTTVALSSGKPLHLDAEQMEMKEDTKEPQNQRQMTYSDYKVILRQISPSAPQRITKPEDVEDILHSTDQEIQFFIDKEYVPASNNGLDWHKWADIALFSFLSIIGIIIIIFKVKSKTEGFNISGELLFDAGLTPFVLATWSLLTGATKFKKFNYIKAFASCILCVAGFVLLWYSDSMDITLLFALSSMEIGVLFFISRMFFLGEDDERTIERLEKQLQTARKAVGAGLALSYFYNFLKPVCTDLYKDKDTKKIYEKGDEIVMLVKEAYNKDPEEHILAKHVMTIFIPRDLNENNLRQSVRSLGYQGHIKNFSTFRGMYQPVLKKWKSEIDGRLYCSGMCDVPTVISSIYDRKLDVDKQRNNAKTQEEKDEILAVDVPKEILDFQNNLIQLIEQYDETRGKVRIISIPPPPISTKMCWEAIGTVDANTTLYEGETSDKVT